MISGLRAGSRAALKICHHDPAAHHQAAHARRRIGLHSGVTIADKQQWVADQAKDDVFDGIDTKRDP